MPIEVVPLLSGIELASGSDAAATFPYLVQGTDNEFDALVALGQGSPSTFADLVRVNTRVESLGPGKWTGTVSYGLAKATGESSFSFDTTGGTQHITQSLGTIGRYAPAGKVAPDFQGAVGVTHESVEGVDITIPVYAFSETHYLADSVVTNAYKGALFAATGKVNNAPFKGCAAGECLFLGASGSKRGSDDWEIGFRFAASPNRSGIVVGTITGISKKGWEYMWVRYQDTDDANAKCVVKRPVAVYIEQVYEYTDLANLGIGT